jgi:hypothetical protein
MNAEAAIDALIEQFFAAFSSGPGLDERLDALYGLFVPKAVVVRGTEQWSVEEFVEPRRTLLAGTSLSGFSEWEEDCSTTVNGNLALRWSTYSKSWTQAGQLHTGGGQKAFSLVEGDEGWRIVSLTWRDDEITP